ncbi:response regulator transcription factor [Shewanella waksmanii]|uniref:response regulator transcription factor n=1 Tax=Shewanella waksmanii TaxID=213783 RepID=UPI003736F94F
MYQGELFTLSDDPINLQLLNSCAGLLDLALNTDQDAEFAWAHSSSKKKILIHFINDIPLAMINLDRKLFNSGKHIAICHNLTLNDELALLNQGFTGACDSKQPTYIMLKVIKQTLEGNLSFSNEALSRYILSQQRPVASTEYLSLFKLTTKKEQEVLSLVCMGLSNNEVAERLSVSINTIKMHLQNIYKKTKVKNRSQLLLAYSR